MKIMTSSIIILQNDKKNDKYANFYFKDEKIFYSIPCPGSSTFAEIEEKLYIRYPILRQSNITFTVNGNEVLRFRTINENNIDNGIPIYVEKFSNSAIKKMFKKSK